MNQDELRYDRLVETALRSVVRQALDVAAPDAMPGDHHFYLTFRTRAPGVSIPDFLLEQYPEEMTIVLQHQFWGLKTDDEHFEVTLSFNNRPADLSIPFAALTAFIDPSVKFGLQFNAEGEGDGEESGTGEVTAANTSAGTADVSRLPVAATEPAETGPDEKPITAPSDEAAARDAAKAAEDADTSGDDQASNDEEPDSADIVSLDSFRKK